MQTFDQVHRAAHYPADRRFRVWINPRFVFAFAVVGLVPVAIAWGQYLIAGLPRETFLPPINPAYPPIPHGFPAWLRLTHFVNFFFLMLLERIQFVETEKTLGQGEGGKNEDDEYFDILPNI